MDNKKMGRKLNMDELEQVAGGTALNRYQEYTEAFWNGTTECNPDFAKFVENQAAQDESARIRESIANGKDYKNY